MENDYADAPAGPVSRPAGPDGPAPDSGAGNQAFVDSRLQAEAFRTKLSDERKVLELDLNTHNSALLRLEEIEAAGEITDKGLADKAALTTRKDQLFKDLVTANQDLLMLDDVSVGPQQLNDMMIRRGTKADVPVQNEVTQGGTQLGPNGIVTQKPGWVETSITNGVSTTQSSSTTSTIDTSGWSTKTTDSTATLSKTGDGTLNSTSNSSTSGLSIGPGGITKNWGDSSASSSTTAAGVTTSSSTTNASSLGTGGYSTSTEVKDDKQTKKDSFGVTRGGGQVGMNASSSTTVDGKENKTTGGVGVLAGPDGVGGAGNLGKAFNQEKGAIKTGQTAGAGRQVRRQRDQGRRRSAAVPDHHVDQSRGQAGRDRFLGAGGETQRGPLDRGEGLRWVVRKRRRLGDRDVRARLQRGRDQALPRCAVRRGRRSRERTPGDQACR